MTRYFVRLAYDGTRFHGWQRQPNGVTVQQTLEETMSMMLRARIELTGAGRTDTGVHAADYYAHFDHQADLGPDELTDLVYHLNEYLKREISIRSVFPVRPDLHARFSATTRTYKYFVSREPDPFRRLYTYYFRGPLDVDLMNKAAFLLPDTKDFTSFSKVDTDTATNICNVSHARWEHEGGELVFTITADRFLRNMVRAVVGTLMQVGAGKLPVEGMQAVIDSHDRACAGDSAPARGLWLWGVEYAELVKL